MKRNSLEKRVLGEVLSWVGVMVAAGVAWGLYAFGENAPRRRVQSQQRQTENDRQESPLLGAPPD
jgi:hypothetical protein